MDNAFYIVGILAGVLIVFFLVFRGRGKFKAKGGGVEVSAEGEAPNAVPAGVNVNKAQAGGDIIAHSGSAGGVSAQEAKAKGEVRATHVPGAPPPKR